eukprot:GHVU01073664.1.p1 GENE.GHVU01073664.1~~GHVU01073664.1.p1  ORF type:complete len:109 (+),score=4.39 GHVU01073664.1:427-753(+)
MAQPVYRLRLKLDSLRRQRRRAVWGLSDPCDNDVSRQWELPPCCNEMRQRKAALATRRMAEPERDPIAPAGSPSGSHTDLLQDTCRESCILLGCPTRRVPSRTFALEV